MAQAAETLTASAGQREPSMEEILASIRRIIEDSDTARAEDAVPPPAANAPPSVEVERFRSELTDGAAPKPSEARPGAGRVEPVAAPPAPSRPVVDVAKARVADPVDLSDIEADAPRSPLGGELMAAHGPAKLESVMAPKTIDETRKPVLAPLTQAAAPVAEAPAEKAAIEPIPEVRPDPRADEPVAADRSEPAPVAVSVQAVEPATGVQRTSILSEVAGRQVAAAFGELEEAFAASRRRSFDEIAEEMMRPMLQEWRDNNLPTLVEKLVREEIERVARGPAR